jgi:hypothetical protein
MGAERGQYPYFLSSSTDANLIVNGIEPVRNHTIEQFHGPVIRIEFLQCTKSDHDESKQERKKGELLGREKRGALSRSVSPFYPEGKLYWLPDPRISMS